MDGVVAGIRVKQRMERCSSREGVHLPMQRPSVSPNSDSCSGESTERSGPITIPSAKENARMFPGVVQPRKNAAFIRAISSGSSDSTGFTYSSCNCSSRSLARRAAASGRSRRDGLRGDSESSSVGSLDKSTFWVQDISESMYHLYAHSGPGESLP